MDANLIPVLLVAVPIGRLGDHHGRRKIMALALLGVAGSLGEIFIVCEFALRACLDIFKVKSSLVRARC
jgi:MFS family permease